MLDPSKIKYTIGKDVPQVEIILSNHAINSLYKAVREHDLSVHDVLLYYAAIIYSEGKPYFEKKLNQSEGKDECNN